jgi:C-terminal processing protease CtpA/Prc
MRAGLGLVGLLICIGVIVWIMHSAILPHTEATLAAKKKAEDTINPIAGYSRDGSMKFSDSLQIETETKGGKIAAIDVTSVLPGGPADTDYGLKENDVIIEIGELSVKDNIQTDSDAMNQIVQFGYERSAPLVIMRDGNKMTLTAHGAPKPAGQAQAKKPNASGGGDPIKQQMDLHSIPGMP